MLLNACKDIGLAVNTGKTKYMEIGPHGRMVANEQILKALLPFSILATCPAHLNPLDLLTPTILG